MVINHSMIGSNGTLQIITKDNNNNENLIRQILFRILPLIFHLLNMDRDVIEICSNVHTNSEQQIHLLFTMNNTPSFGHSRERVKQRELWEGKMQQQPTVRQCLCERDTLWVLCMSLMSRSIISGTIPPPGRGWDIT